MKKLMYVLLAMFMIFTVAACAGEEDDNNDNGDQQDELDLVLPEAFVNLVDEKDVYLTTIGQTADLDTAYNLLSNIFDNNLTLLVEHVTKNELLTAANVPVGALVIIVPGASSKGMGAAGTNQTNELARANDFAARAEAGEITIVIIHTGLMQRRGVESDPLITASSNHAVLMMVSNGGNTDGFFTTLSNEHDVPLYLYTGAAQMIPPLRQIFNR